ncbi:MAG: UvrD-helicase domain-containing protein [Bryobacteraceae bacterium]|nr:UvrD-helicase domain-containing protein [Bryobacteraceae bacterium]
MRLRRYLPHRGGRRSAGGGRRAMMLSAEQRRAVERWDQDVCVVAGPGSGKTRVLTERFAWLVEERGVDPARLLAITFTEKAAAEIKDRLVRRFEGSPERRQALERAWVSTIHGFCARMLREYATEAGVDPRFLVLDPPGADRLRREAAETVLEELFARDPRRLRDLLDALELTTRDDMRQADLAGSLIELWDTMRAAPKLPRREVPRTLLADTRERAFAAHRARDDKEQSAAQREWIGRFLAAGESPTLAHVRLLHEYDFNGAKLGRNTAGADFNRFLKTEKRMEPLMGECLDALHAPLRATLESLIDGYAAEYQDRKRGLSALDFDDLEEAAVRLLETHDNIREQVRLRFDQILMDEVQDTNPRQWALLDLLRRPDRFFAVGDINQSIYGFRHAEPRLFAEYRASLENSGRPVDDLRDNHRSRAGVLQAVEAVCHGLRGIESRPLEARHEYAHKPGPSVEILVGEGDDEQEAEAALIAARIGELAGGMELESGVARYRDCAVLARTLNALDPIRAALDRAGIPWIITGGRTFLETREVRDVINLLAVLANSLDEIAMAGVLRSPLVGIGDESLLRHVQRKPLVDPEDRFRLDQFRALLSRWRPYAEAVSPDRLLRPFLDASDYEGGLGERQRANVDKLLSLLRQWHSAAAEPPGAVLDRLRRLRAAGVEAEAPPSDPGNVVQLMTIHQSKGLEFPVVFLAAMNRSGDSRAGALVFSPRFGLGVKWRNPFGSNSVSDPIRTASKDELKEREESEESRLLYVAMTRAREHLALCWAATRGRSPWRERARGKVGWVTPRTSALIPAGPAAVGAPPGGPAAVTIVEKPEVHGQYDSAVPVTTVALAAADRPAYLLHRLRGLKATQPDWEAQGEEMDWGELDAGELGTQVHELLAGNEVPHAGPEARELAARFPASEWGRRAARASRLEREFDFLLAIEDVVLKGQIDLWFEEGGELILIDYKTGHPGRERHEVHQIQLRLYAMALEKFAGRMPDRVLIYRLREDRTIEVGMSEEDRRHALDAVREWKAIQERFR